MKSIRDFDTIPEALRAILNGRNGRPLSIRELSRKLGYNSDRTVGMVVKGERVMGGDMLRRISDFAHLSRKDKDYLALLALKQRHLRQGRAVDQIEKQLADTRGKSSASKPVEISRLEALTPWYAFAVIEVLTLVGGVVAQEDIHRQLRGAINPAELEQTLLALAEFGYIMRTEGGKFRALETHEYLTTPIDIPSTTVRKMHRRQLERAADALNEQAVNEREVISKSFTVSSARLTEFKQRIRETMEELAEEFVAPQADDAVVVQLNQQLYQQSKPRIKRDPEKL